MRSSTTPNRGSPCWRWSDSPRSSKIARGHFLQVRAMQSTTILPMLCEQTTHQWLGRFAVRLMQLRQNISLPAAVTRAVCSHAHSSDMLPEAAAQLDAAVSTWRLPPTPVAYTNGRYLASNHSTYSQEHEHGKPRGSDDARDGLAARQG